MITNGNDQILKEHRLYGREAAITTLLQSFTRISSNGGRGEVILVPGHSGVGKTSLVREISSTVRERNGFFLQGKFNQYQKNIPYFAIQQALTGLALELKSESPLIQERWKSSLREAVGSLGRLLVDLVPEFESLLGTFPPVAEIGPLEARHRFGVLLRNFFMAICRLEHPVVLFIDDWQWADTASFELLKQLQIGTTLRYLLVVAPYRDNEVDSAHPLVATLEELSRQAVPITTVEVHNLTVTDVQTWIKDLLQPTTQDPQALAQRIHQRTEGNPFFTQASLEYLLDFDFLNFKKSDQCWHWQTMLDGPNVLPKNVVELFHLRLLRLTKKDQSILSLAACLGNKFKVDSLAFITHLTRQACCDRLLELKEMVQPVDQTHFVFIHDSVQQAAYGLIPPADLPSIHLRIARVLLARLKNEQLMDRLFEVTTHLNRGRSLIEIREEQLQTLKLNMEAARKARVATAYGEALHFHRCAGHLLSIASFAQYLFKDHRGMARSLLKEWAESEFIEGERTSAEHYIEQAVELAQTPLEKADALNILIVQNTLLARYPQAIAASRQALALLGIILPEEAYQEASQKEIEQVRHHLQGRSVASLRELPIMSDPLMCMAVKILITTGPPCYRANQLLWSVIVPKVINLTLEYGNTAQIGYAHPAFAGLLCWTSNDFSLAREFIEVATRLMTEVFHSPSDKSVYALMLGSSARHWFSHLHNGSADYALACDIGLQSNNLQYTAYAFGHNMYCQFYQGIPLEDLMQESQRALAFSQTRLNQWAIDLLMGGLKIFSALSQIAIPLEEAESDYLMAVDAHQNIQVTCIYKILKTFLLFLHGHYQEAFELANEVTPILYTVGMQGLLPWPEHLFTRFLILASLNSDQHRDELNQIFAQLQLWAHHSPENFTHKYHLAAAELARIDGHAEEAATLYEQAIAEAKAQGFLQWMAIANERAARFWSQQMNGFLAQIYWQQAYGHFERWGAKAKLQIMEQRCAQWLPQYLPNSTRNSLLNKQLQILHGQVIWMAEVRMQSKIEKQAKELAQATASLCAEVAERRKIEEELRLHREQLEERILQRTSELEKSLQERKRIEEKISTLNQDLEQRVKERTALLETANQDLESFAYSVSHDLRTPLRAIDGFSQAILEDHAACLDAAGTDYLHRVRSAAQRMDQLINDILNLSRVSRSEMIMARVHLSRIAQTIADDLMLREPTRTVIFTIAPNVEASGDARFLRVALENLLGNAWKFTSTRAEAKIEFGVTEGRDGPTYFVRDNGVGFDMKYADRLFLAFQRLHSSNEFPGSGIGLATVERIIHRHMGCIWAESQINQQATFYFTLRR